MKNNFFAGLALMVIAFTGAAFTANSTLQTNHYIKKDGVCQPIPTTNCNTTGSNACLEEVDGDEYQVFQSQSSPTECQTPLRRPANP